MSSAKDHRIRVLLADDHAIVRDGLRLVLGAQDDIEVVGDAENGRDAVLKASQLTPDVVVMDISMPGLNGIEATERIREQQPGTRVLILSMHATAEHIYRALQAGADGYLLKESAGLEVVSAVRSVHLKHRFFSEKITEMLIGDYVTSRGDGSTRSPLEQLSSREREVLQLVVEGRSSAEIGGIIHLSPKTVDTYRSRLMRKLGVHDVASLVRFAITHGVAPSG